MSANTSPDNIVYPVSTDQVAPLETVFAALAISVQNALTAQAKYFAPVVATQAARDALFPTAAQGNRVFRADKGWEETFFGLYDAATNLGGATPAGWYPTAGTMPKFSGFNANQNISNSTQVVTFGSTIVPVGFTYLNGVYTSAITGDMLCTASAVGGTGGTAYFEAYFRKNSADMGRASANQVATQDRNTASVSRIISVVPGDTLAFMAIGNTGMTIANVMFSGTYVGHTR